jgi:3-hydroxyacyl-[acyl-carrier protein] dehydratase / trans-2-decenoyl-[acyl-carrier protein] isomerase
MNADGQVIYTATDLRVGLFETGDTAAALSS